MGSIKIIMPTNNALVCDESVDVLGCSSEVNSVFINGIDAVINGNTFTAKVPLSLGNNEIEVRFSDIAGKWQSNILRVKRLKQQIPPFDDT